MQEGGAVDVGGGSYWSSMGELLEQYGGDV